MVNLGVNFNTLLCALALRLQRRQREAYLSQLITTRWRRWRRKDKGAKIS
jgi:hypothetical protein